MSNNGIKISGIQKTSLIDYPDHISTVLFTQGCNMNCPYCHNPELIDKDSDNEYLNLDYFWEFLDQRKDLIDGVVITGGEPLIQESIIDLLREIKNYDLLIKVDTNGTNYKLLKQIINNKLVDYIAMDFKGPLKEYNKFCGTIFNNNTIENIDKSKNLLINSNIEYELRTTVVPGMHSIEDMEKISKHIFGSQRYYIQNFRSDKVNDQKFKDKRSFSEKELEEFKFIFKKESINVEIRS